MSTHEQLSPHGDGSQADYHKSSSGPVRTNDFKADDRDRKGPIAAPVKSACTFCRSRKSRCDGNKPCSACVGRGRPDECLYTVSRRGGKPKPKADPTQDLQSHLNKLFAMTDMPYAFRRPGGLAGPSGSEMSPSAGMQQPQQIQPHSNIFNIPTQYQSFDPSVLQQPSSMQPNVSMQPQHTLQSPQQSQAPFSLNDPLQDPFAQANAFQAGGFMRYQLPDASMQMQMPPQQSYPYQQPLQQQQQQPPQQPQQPQTQQQQQQVQGLPTSPMQAGGSGFNDSALQHNPAQPMHSQQGPAPGLGISTTRQDQSSPHSLANEGGRVPSVVSPQSHPSPGWSRVNDSMAAYNASSVAVRSSSSQSGSSRTASTEPGIDSSKMLSMSYQSLNAAAAEAGSVKALLVDYYRYLYRFIPVLPPPKHIGVLATFFKPDSAFIYALQCVLPLLRDEIQPIGALHKLSGQGINFGSEEKKAALRERTLSFERKTTDGLDRLLEQADGDETGEKTLEAVQTLCVLVVYEYGSGRAIKARLKADQALGLAMGQGLHKLSRKTSPDQMKSAPSSFAYVSTARHPLTSMGVDPNDIFEMRKRCWWSVWSLVLWAAYNTGRIPTIRADDPRVKSEMPVASHPDVWTSNISSLQALLVVQDRVLALAQYGQSGDGGGQYEPPRREVSMSPASSADSPFAFGRLGASRAASVTSDDIPATFSTLPTRATRQEILDSMLEIDNFLQEQIRISESTEAPDSPLPSEVPSTGDLAYVEKELEDSLRMAAAVQLYTSSLTLHIGQAFQGASLFERKLCFLNSIKDNKDGSGETAVCREPMPALTYDDMMDAAPFSAANGNTNGNGFGTGTDASPNSGLQVTSLSQQDLYARGPFLPRLSLQRCVHASRKLLDIAKRRHGQSVNPNPFNCCSFVLISFVLLMQALAVHGGFAGESGEAQQDGEAFGQQDGEVHSQGQYANDSLQRMLDSTDDDTMMDSFEPSIDPAKQAQLRDIWSRVREARDTLMDLGKHWEAVVPMADEVNLCLETSQLLLSNSY